ncbi:NAD(+)/NADH kinase, partial [Aeromonas salmonicida]|uniref:NAD(+)/NADH kinase n=1 Tax=Aeromonas salmonicida TaxID=645 RepID=UPI003D3144AD
QSLTSRGFSFLVCSPFSQPHFFLHYNLMDLVQLGEQADLAIVVGGDGNMLGAARGLSRVAVAGIWGHPGELRGFSGPAPR